MGCRVQFRLAQAGDSAQFRAVATQRRRSVGLCAAMFLTGFGAFVLLVSYARGLTGHLVFSGTSAPYLLALAVTVLIWAVAAAYLCAATRTLRPLQEAVVNLAAHQGASPTGCARVQVADSNGRE